MPGNGFIQFMAGGKFPLGESLEAGHEGKDGWIEISEWSWDCESESSAAKGMGSSTGKPKPGNFTFSHFYDKSSSVLMTMIVKGQTFDKVTVECLKQTGSGTPKIYLQLMFQDAFICKVSSKGGEDGAVTQDVEFTFKQMALGYKKQENGGALEKAAREFHWNVPEQTDSTPKLSVKM